MFQLKRKMKKITKTATNQETNKMKKFSIARKILDKPIYQWQKETESVPASSLQDIEIELGLLIQQASLLHAYIANRFNTGCGEYSHEESCEEANKQLIKIRKAMGYTCPDFLTFRMK